MEEVQGELITVETLAADFRRLGVCEGMTMLLHSSFKSLGQWVAGGPVAVILALEQVLGEEGTLVMPTHSSDLTDPSGWSNPPVPEAWWPGIREHMPAYDPDLTLLRGMGVIPETFRKQKGVKRSSHPINSFAAWGRHRDEIIDGHALEYAFGEQSPLARIYDLKGSVLLLGVDSLNNTSLHLAEYRAEYAGKQEVTAGAPMRVDGARHWVEFRDYNWNSEDFAAIGGDFGQETGQITYGKVAAAPAQLIPQREIVDYAVKWLEQRRV
ncbi:aminoglycoside N(3)-acetyltransferase [Paenibacillus jilunlii]|uniref:Aminoglycoside N(3)-acetyltransferase n=1 Tax=Paenibacillus jilunlii TaxID=682956 RepID=A0A1G9IJR1_9BACL|nr:AAC(3) family N-acetyltransferase [Paenibacillus jilunlii]KWX72793.1 aminoglycoside 3-N-acetyltransferase [Paenibacillus jilunlii]SDL25410.1 aminoglycoside 3-N-acetyltransferase [Paenibacillus jilunlii]